MVLMNLEWDEIRNRRYKHRGLWWWSWFHPEKLRRSPRHFREFFEWAVKNGNVPDDYFSEWEHCTGYGGVEPIFDENGWSEGDFALNTVRYALENMDQGRHYRVLKALVADRDSSVICCELPIWGRIKDGGDAVEQTGHIDAVESFDGRFYVLDFKPEAESPHEHARQVEAYRRMLAKRIGVDHREIGVGIFSTDRAWRCPIHG